MYRARGGRAGFCAGFGDLGDEGMRCFGRDFAPINSWRLVFAAVGTSICVVFQRWHFGQTARQFARLLSFELWSRMK
ncbi:hypothetical protein BG36_21035 [Aquamicrobium defluvii]|uniref:Uncharacterized protein n=1 Tax=Aquamicrobium defluvii TaxID=69279 RepID=A0A011VMW7_9HYPH|nr:hypothetical protein BG36_21035 [Aquamicrobium defluvii]